MLKSTLKIIVLSAILFSSAPAYAIKPVYAKAAVKTSKILISEQKLHEFSAKNKKDTFQITASGNNLLDSKIVLKITAYTGKIIYQVDFTGKDLIPDDRDNQSKNQKEEYIKKRIKSFFNENQFKSPAILPEQKFDEDYSDKNSWNDIKNDKSSVGFIYLIGYEDVRHIAYSKKLKKVVLYFNCC